MTVGAGVLLRDAMGVLLTRRCGSGADERSCRHVTERVAVCVCLLESVIESVVKCRKKAKIF